MQPTFYKTGTTVGRYWKEILTQISDAVIIYDENGIVHFANQSALVNLHFRSATELTVDSIDSIDDIMDRFNVIDENGAAVDREAMPSRSALRGETTKEAILHFTELHGKEDYWLVVKAFPIFDSRRRVRYVVVIFQDITSFKTTEASLKDANQRMMAIIESAL